METDRLIVRNFKQDDWNDLYEYLSQKEVLRYEPGSTSSQDECMQLASERSKGNNFWAVCLKENDKMIGHLYFQQTDPAEFLTWELGYIFNPSYYRRGYATEASKRIIQYAFEELGAHRIVAMCNPGNAPSWKLMERLHMRREGYFKKKAFFRKNDDGTPIWHDAYEYAILQEEWAEMGEEASLMM
jgi:RimJ/RimL family protein N-acetyltransferase